MVVTRTRRHTTPASASPAAQHTRPNRRTRTRAITAASSKKNNNNNNDALEADKENHDNSRSTTTHPMQSDAKANASLNKDAPLTTRGTRIMRDTRRTPATTTTASNNPTEDEEVERPRRERVEAVVIVEHPRKLRSWETLDNNTRAHTDAKIPIDLHDDYALNFETSMTTDAFTTDMLKDSSPKLRKHNEANVESGISGKSDDHNSMLFSRLSLSPPPPLLFDNDDEEDYYGEGNSPWRMNFDSRQSSSCMNDQSRRRTIDFTLLELEPDEQQHKDRLESSSSAAPATAAFLSWDKDGAMDDYDEDDDPFGFSKVERKLQRTKSMRPKLLAINEVNARSPAVSASAMAVDTTTSRISSPSTSIDRSTIDENGLTTREAVLERVANRRRGDVKGKGKIVEQDPLSSDSHDADRSRSEAAEFSAEDIQRAVQLSRGLDVANGEGCSSGLTASSTSQSGARTTATEGDNTILQETIATDQDDEETLTRSTRRISRLYGKAAAVGVQNAQTLADTTASTAHSNAHTPVLDDNTYSHDIEMEAVTDITSTPPRKTRSDDSTNSDLSILSSDFSPIILDRTPTRKPEAGMPMSLEYPSTGPGKGRSRPKKKYMLTEQLEAMLPRRRRKLNMMSKNRNNNVVDLGSSSEEDENDSDGSIGSASEDERESLTRLRRGRTATHSVDTRRRARTLGKKRSAPGELSKPVSKRGGVKGSASVSDKDKRKDKGKGKAEDRSGWSAEQWAAQQERIKYFQQVDDFDLEVEPI
ncbi:hypothetical protein BC939DRAFT_476421 [Gamsiella multidivaricata]|uniref:uncharacterized protein n=1 Tax=Gamsiella multidivaricata TaxID=101098 RepID=UPI002221180D|nr:uncharacterized protein BC939DRAFT_476421 [Gamsiella multidivaricata]KAG0363043.1 hypothetical protein BGZ54_008368 [Gamsiella multidivaricata]KAI7825201.1 hypothetical protein BC939DRAFT_476421 [Gamsiella multidivaricata]